MLGVSSELDQETLHVLADGGYSNGEQLAACDAEGITVTLPIHRSINDLTDAYPKSAFTYDTDQDCYICPAGEHLTHKTVSRKEKQQPDDDVPRDVVPHGNFPMLSGIKSTGL